jgi:DNA-binding NtrC family response regulator
METTTLENRTIVKSARPLNIFILNHNVDVAGKLRKYLMHRFGDMVNISLFFNSRSLLRMIDNHVDMVVVDDYLKGPGGSGKPGVEVLKKIKEEHPHTEVVILSSHEDVGLAIEALKSGAKEFILDKRGAFHRIRVIVDQMVSQPIRYLVAEYGVTVFVIAFLGLWTVLGVITWLALKYIV